MENTGGFRTQVSFMVSILLHGGVITFLALGPLFLTSKSVAPDAHQTTVAFATATSAAPAESTAAAEAPKPAAVQPVAAQPAPVPAPKVVKKSAPKKIAVAKTSAVKQAQPKAPEQVVAPQEVLTAENSETPLEKAAEPVAPAAVAAEEDVAPNAKDSEFSGEKPQTTPATAPIVDEQPKAVEPAPLPAPVIPPQAAPAQNVAATNSSAQPLSAEKAGGAENIAAASAASGVDVTQSYLGLKQMSGNKPPTYSRDMRMAQMQGAGQLVYYVNKDGGVSQMKLTKSTGYPELDQAAIDAFSKYRFVPGQEGYTVHNFEFSLKGPAISDVGRLRTTMK